MKISSFKQYIPLIVLGFNALSAQIIIFRELISVFNGNELVTGILLANWLIITAMGSYIGKLRIKQKCKSLFLFLSLLILIVIPIITTFLINYLKNIIFMPGISLGIYQIIFISFIILFPFCFLAGFLFPFLSDYIKFHNTKDPVILAYGYESIGSMLGGIIFNFILVYFMPTFKILSILMAINIMALIYYFATLHLKYAITLVFLLIIPFYFLFFKDIDFKARSFLFPNQKIITFADTPYGNIVVTESAGQINFYENNIVLFHTENNLYNEEIVHFAMLQHKKPEQILLVSGGINDLEKEIFKYDIKNIDYIEINPYLIDFYLDFFKEKSFQKTRFIKSDLRYYIDTTTKKYDVIILNLPEPVTLQLNRFYTFEFFYQLKKVTNNNAIVIFGLPPTVNYISSQSKLLNSTIYNTCKNFFQNITIISGAKNYFIMSDSIISLDIAKMVTEKGITNHFVNSYYIDDLLLKNRSNYILQNIDDSVPYNKDYKPICYKQQISIWLSQFHKRYNFSMILLGLLILFMIIFSKPINIGIFSTGLTAASLELLIINGFQITYGNIHHNIGIIFLLFMAGLAIATIFIENNLIKNPEKQFIYNQFILAFYSVIAIILISSIKPPSFQYFKILYFLLAFFTGILTGLQFATANRISSASIINKAGILYSADTIGSAIGSLLVSLVLLPKFGFLLTGLSVGGLNILIGIFLLLFLKLKN